MRAAFVIVPLNCPVIAAGALPGRCDFVTSCWKLGSVIDDYTPVALTGTWM